MNAPQKYRLEFSQVRLGDLGSDSHHLVFMYFFKISNVFPVRSDVGMVVVGGAIKFIASFKRNLEKDGGKRNERTDGHGATSDEQRPTKYYFQTVTSCTPIFLGTTLVRSSWNAYAKKMKNVDT